MGKARIRIQAGTSRWRPLKALGAFGAVLRVERISRAALGKPCRRPPEICKSGIGSPLVENQGKAYRLAGVPDGSSSARIFRRASSEATALNAGRRPDGVKNPQEVCNGSPRRFAAGV
jgi:hypothetical protein